MDSAVAQKSVELFSETVAIERLKKLVLQKSNMTSRSDVEGDRKPIQQPGHLFCERLARRRKSVVYVEKYGHFHIGFLHKRPYKAASRIERNIPLTLQYRLCRNTELKDSGGGKTRLLKIKNRVSRRESQAMGFETFRAALINQSRLHYCNHRERIAYLKAARGLALANESNKERR